MAITGPRIEITVDPKGQTTTEVIGVPGDDCKAVSAEYEALFGDVLEHKATAEAYEEPEEIEIKAEQGGK